MPGEAPEQTLLILVRHGESLGNQERRFGGHGPTPLSPRGREQARRTAERISRRYRPTAVISSDLPRARETAEPIARASGAALELDFDLRERGLGILDGLRFEEAAERHPDLWRQLIARDPHFEPPGGESVASVYERVGRAIEHLLSAHRGGSVVVVSHALAIFHGISRILGLQSPARGSGVFIHVDNASLSVFLRRDDAWRVESINDCAHLVQDEEG